MSNEDKTKEGIKFLPEDYGQKPLSNEGKTKKECIGVVPLYQEEIKYAYIFMKMHPWESDDWKEVSLSWKESCYIHSGISGFEITIKGPDAQKLLSMASINDVYKWKYGFGKHLVMCDERGLISSHGLFVRDNEDTFRAFAMNPWPIVKLLQTGKYNAELTTRENFIIQCSGPMSLTVLEKVTQESLRDVEFLMTRTTQIPGIDAEIEIQRIGMTGTLAYELRGAADDGPAVYDAVYQAGKEYGMKRLGWRTYVVNHVEGGFPQTSCTFLQACNDDPDFIATGMNLLPPKHTGSIDPSDARARYRTPVEVGWIWMAKFDHDFVGRAAVEAEAKNPKRTVVNLRWNTEDILDIHASYFEPGEPYKFIEYPCVVPQPAGGHADHVLTPDGKKIGISTAPIYSYYYRDIISQSIIDIDQATLGNEVIVLWGDYGKRIKEVRATVVRYPYIDLPRNENYDLSTVPSGVPSSK